MEVQRHEEAEEMEEADVGALRTYTHRVDHIPSSSKQRRQQGRDPGRRRDGAGGGHSGGSARGGQRRRGLDSSRRYKARLSAPEVDEGTCGVGRVSWPLY